MLIILIDSLVTNTQKESLVSGATDGQWNIYIQLAIINHFDLESVCDLKYFESYVSDTDCDSYEWVTLYVTDKNFKIFFGY